MFLIAFLKHTGMHCTAILKSYFSRSSISLCWSLLKSPSLLFSFSFFQLPMSFLFPGIWIQGTVAKQSSIVFMSYYWFFKLPQDLQMWEFTFSNIWKNKFDITNLLNIDWTTPSLVCNRWTLILQNLAFVNRVTVSFCILTCEVMHQ